MKYTCQTDKCSLAGMVYDTRGNCPRCGKPRVEAQLYDPNLDIRGDRIEPDPAKDSLKLCFYKALAKAQYADPKKGWEDIIGETKPLRSRYRVAFDEDGWAPALAEFYSFERVDTGVAYPKVLKTCEDWHAQHGKGKTTQYFVIALENKDKEVNGHAIYVEYAGQKGKSSFKVVDNENTTQTDRIAHKFVHSFFDIYGRTQDAGERSRAMKPEVKQALLSQNSIRTLEHLERNKE